jgi:hypothetical protein
LQEIKKKMTAKIPRDFFSENRAFDRTQALDKCDAVWKDLSVELEEVELGHNEMVQSESEWFELDV